MVVRYLRAIVLFTFVGVIFALYGCGGGGSLTPNPKEEPASVVVSIADNYKVVQPNGTTKIPFTVFVYKGDGELAKDVKVQVSADPDVGTFDSYVKTANDGKATFYYTVPSYDIVTQENLKNVSLKATLPEYSGITGSNDIYFNISASKIIATIPDNSTILPANNSITVPVTVYVYGGDGKPMSGVNIYASAYPNIGSFDKVVNTTSDAGIATFNYTLPSKDDAEKLLAKSVILSFYNEDKTVADNITISFDNIEIGNGLPTAIMMSAQPYSIFTSSVASGPKVSQITARVVDSSGRPIYSGYNVKFSILQAPNGTYIYPSVVPITNGTAIAGVVSGSEGGTVLIRATVEGYTSIISSSAIVYVSTGQASKITLLGSGKIIAQDDNGTRSQNIYAFVKDSSGAPVSDGTVVYFSLTDSCGGMIQQEGITKDGIAEATLVYPKQCIWKSYSVYAETSGGGVSGTLNDYYPAVSPVSLSLAGPNSIGANGGYITIVATIKDENGDGLPIEGANIMFSSSVDNVTFNPTTATTGINGIASTTVRIPPLDNTTTQRTITITGQTNSAIGSIDIIQQQQ